MTRSWHIRPYQDGDETQILKLREVVFGDLDPVRLKESTWQWQFQNNPSGPAFCFLAEAGGTIVGQYAAIPTRFSIQGKETLVALSCDTMIHPHYRRQGMFSALARELYDFMENHCGITMVWGFPNNQSLPGFTGRLGWRMLPFIPLMVLPIRPLAMVHRSIPLLKRLGKKAPAKIETDLDFKFSPRLPGLRIDPIRHFDEAFDELWQTHSSMPPPQSRRASPVMQVRDSRYLQWRYLSVPEFGYRPFAVRRHGRLLGYMILRMMTLKGHMFGVLMDLFPFPMASDLVLNDVFSLARQYVKAHGGDFLTCLLPRGNAGVLKRAGFKKVPEIINPKTWRLGYRCTGAALPDDFDSWHITYGDTDVV